MISRIKNWLYGRFLPAWAKDVAYRENEASKAEIATLKAENARLNAYIDGLEDGIRAQRRIIINNGVKK